MINLIFFLPTFNYGGAGNSIFRLCKKLNKKKYNISIISIGPCAYKKELKNIERMGGAVTSIENSYMKQNLVIHLLIILCQNLRKNT